MPRPVQIRPLAAPDAEALRDLRLAALAEAPRAFGSSVQEEQPLGLDHFRRWADAGEKLVILGAFADGRLVGMAGGIGGFYLASSLGYSRQITGSYQLGLTLFAFLAVLALLGLSMVKKRWRTTWGSAAMTTINIAIGFFGLYYLLLDGPALALRQRVLDAISQLPNPDPRALHALADALAGTDPQVLATFMDLVNGWLSQRLGRGDGDARNLARAAEVWDKVNRTARDVDAYNLERKPFVFSVFTELAALGRA